MKKLLYLLLPVIAFALGSCNDDDDGLIDTRLIKGQWEVASPDSPDRGCIYNFTTQSDHTWSWGLLTTYYLTLSGAPLHDKVYEWHVSDPENDPTVYLDMTLIGLLDGDDAWKNTEHYIVERLTATLMILKKNETTDDKTRVKFIRRNDLPLPN
ncbi:MAG: hypothetical protein K2I64_04060 [Muribaculaceae bacterium]|nr:hypothetical protein [Muribaculaceae bacterium]